MNAAEKLAPKVGTASACRAMGVSRATLYRRRHPVRKPKVGDRAQRRQPRALDAAQRRHVLDLLHSERFADEAPAAVYATLLDEGTYHGSIRTMYRILHENDEVRERRHQLRHPRYQKPQLLATGANQVWSWDITKLLGPAKWTYYYLYVILDIYSRYAVGWMLASRESADLARRLIRAGDRKAKRRRREADPPQRPWPVDEVTQRGPVAGRLGRHQVPQPASGLERQPVFGWASSRR